MNVTVTEVSPARLPAHAAVLLDAGHRLALTAAHEDPDGSLRVVYLFTAAATGASPERRDELHVQLDPSDPVVPSLAQLTFPAGRFELEMRDLYGIVPADHPLPKPEARLRFLHKGLEKLFEGRLPVDALPLAERVSGDTAVGHALAFCLAVEDAAGVTVSPGAQRTRALLLELERLYNHVTDLGALCDDVGHSILNAHFGRVREQLLRLNAATTGHRLLRGGVVPGGALLLAVPDAAGLQALAADIAELVDLALGHTAVLDRFTGTAPLSLDAARDLGTLGYVARASGLDVDARRDHPITDLRPALTVATRSSGDVLARFQVRADEIAASIALVTDLAYGMSPGLTSYWPPLSTPGERTSGTGVVEGWRGTIVHRVELAAGGTLSRTKIVDPSFLNRPALPVALTGTTVPDVPLAGRSFHLSHAGADL
ncbi:NADH-quinone oxidoreductase subunit C [Spirillospora sp. NPDC052269]